MRMSGETESLDRDQDQDRGVETATLQLTQEYEAEIIRHGCWLQIL